MSVRSLGSLRVTYLLLVAIIGIGMFLVWYATLWGAGLISDSYQYTASARNFVLGNGFSLPYGEGELEPMTKYPPFFSVVLGAFELIGITALQGARVINIILFGVNIFLVFYSTQKLTRSSAFSLLASLLFAVSFVAVEVHSWVLSEPLYICLGLTSFLLIQKYFEENRTVWLILASVAVALACLTRYVGLSLVISIGLILLVNRVEVKQRIRDGLLFGVISILPVTLWTLRGYMLTQTLNDRMVAFHPLTTKNYAAMVDVVYGWLLPSSFVQGQEKILLALTALTLIGVVLLFWKFQKATLRDLIKEFDPQKQMILLHGIYIVVYGLVIVASKTWIDPDIGLSDRILSPMFVSLLILLAVSLSILWNQFRIARPFVVLISFGLVAYYAATTFVVVQSFHETGIGIARRGWHRSDVIQSLRSYSSYPIYTNSNSSLYLWSDRAGYNIPEFEALKETGTDSEVLLVIFHHVPPSGKRLDEITSGLKILNEDQVASIYALIP